MHELGRIEIEGFLSEIAAHPGISNWQAQQARNALELHQLKFRGVALEPRESVSAHPHEHSPARFPPLAGDAPHTVSGATSNDFLDMRLSYSKPSAGGKSEKIYWEVLDGDKG